MPRIETAAGERRDSFPTSWGVPPGAPFSSERAAWVARNIHQACARVPVRGTTGNSSEAALKKALSLKAGSLERNAHLALWRVESLARDSGAALRYATHL